VALFSSTQSGNWNNQATWGGSGVPNMSIDDALINPGHEVIVPSGLYVSVYDGHAVIVLENATLRIQGGMDIGDGAFFVLGYVIAEGNHLALWGTTTAEIWSSGQLEVQTNFYLDGATMTVDGLFSIYGGYANIQYGATLNVVSGYWELYSAWAYIEYSNISVESGVYIDYGSGVDMYDYATLTIQQYGYVDVYGNLYLYYYPVVEVFGLFGLEENGYLYVDYQSRINVYRHIYLSGRMYGGGRIVMLRREGRIFDYYGNSLIVLDRAYGFGVAHIA
jgi:hypothetical protein